ncbi:MAG: hypothetical protein A2133_12750 [Actinobacteria bacterium RBG_16_64_13]|nr:MAG: hypothetical protein A2133_12750 [Actinobacteria bacterium RBG_16_64_13]
MNQGEVPRWEYRVLSVPDHLVHTPTEEVLNELGGEGWELAGIDTSLADHPRYVFKRQLVSPEPVPEMDEEQERWLRNASVAEALLALPAERRDELLREVLSDGERESASPPEDFHERVLLHFAQKKEGTRWP